MFELRPVEVDFFQTAPLRVVSAATLSATPAAVFEALVDRAAEMPRWFSAVRSVEYGGGAYGSSGPGSGPGSVPVGTRRRVRLIDRSTFHETVLAVDAPHRFAYRIDRTTVPGLRAMAEEWTVVSTDAGTRVAWTVAVDGPAITRAGLWATAPGLRAATRRALAKLDRELA